MYLYFSLNKKAGPQYADPPEVNSAYLGDSSDNRNNVDNLATTSATEFNGSS
jgi:hypothetical protein